MQFSGGLEELSDYRKELAKLNVSIPGLRT